ncbi:hypothetical protein QBC32DRAFT_143998 [Pseudoneurospora amorphoporcata]|uniref:C2H2-type domain-containing protein n=1 Tax=Pseudoneurospora amorphoporcata TaxID=241081 RepID=A0AAN6SFI3_9PEZI|nr:hypothetical protein QBC32DRAFT_143998 [Pseudoneurospora amorphoporcata]
MFPSGNQPGLLPHVCHICGVSCESEQVLQQHIQTHGMNAVWPFECPHCHQRYARNDLLVQHIRICRPGENLHPFQDPQHHQYIQNNFLQQHAQAVPPQENPNLFEDPQHYQQYTPNNLLHQHPQAIHAGENLNPLEYPRYHQQHARNDFVEQSLEQSLEIRKEGS